MFPCEYCKIDKNTYFEEDLQTTASGNMLSQMQISLLDRYALSNRGADSQMKLQLRFFFIRTLLLESLLNEIN